MSKLIKQQFTRTRGKLSETLEDVSTEVFEIVPDGFNNNIHWQLGHLLITGELFLFGGQKNLPENYRDFFKPGTKPSDWTSEVPSVNTLLGQLNEQLDRINDIPAEVFERKLPKPFLGNETAGELAAMGAYHEAMHLGQIQSLKRLIEVTQVSQS
jgi:hypothetical protein